MNKLICRLFVKNWQNTEDVTVRQNYGKLAGIIGVVSNLLLTVIKIIAGLMSGSVAIIADSVNNLTDSISSIITLLGFKLSSLPEDKEHPYGHARIEYIAGMIISVLMVVAGIELGKESIMKTIHPKPVDIDAVIIIILVISIVIKIWQATFNKYAGREIKSTTLEATGADSRNDVIVTSALLAGIIFQYFTGKVIDGPLGIAISVFIIISGIQLTKETISPLLGEKPDPMLVHNIKNMVLSYKGVLGTHDLVVHNYGPGKIFASIHIEVDAKGNLMESHDLIDNIENEVSRKLGIVLTAHTDPIIIDDPEVTRYKQYVCSTASKLDGVSNVHDLRIVKGPTHTNVIFDVVVSSDCKMTHQEITDYFQDKINELGDQNYIAKVNFDGEYAN